MCQGGVLLGGENGGDKGEGIWLMGIVYTFEIEW
jgi:hypothetical protein